MGSGKHAWAAEPEAMEFQRMRPSVNTEAPPDEQGRTAFQRNMTALRHIAD
jgi:hypothetical protein